MAKKRVPKDLTPAEATAVDPAPRKLLADLRSLIQAARSGIAQAVNSAQVLLYWQVGQRILAEILRHDRAAYGEEIVATVSRQLTADYGRGFAEKSLRRMIQFARVYSDREIVAALSRELGWSHFVELLPLEDDLKRQFYGEMCRIERWSVRTLRAKIDGMLFERTALSRKPAKLADQAADKVQMELYLRWLERHETEAGEEPRWG
jgi:hypothetical protein